MQQTGFLAKLQTGLTPPFTMMLLRRRHFRRSVTLLLHLTALLRDPGSGKKEVRFSKEDFGSIKQTPHTNKRFWGRKGQEGCRYHIASIHPSIRPTHMLQKLDIISLCLNDGLWKVCCSRKPAKSRGAC
jgi:hypothetical protein